MANKSSSRQKSDREQEEPEDGDETREESGPPSWLEQVATGVSALIVAGMFGVLIHDATHTDAPPAFDVVTNQMQTVGSSLRVPVEVRNTGDEAAHEVHVHIELRGADSVLAETDLTIDWLAGRSKHDVVGFFEKPSAPFKAHAEVRGYAEP